MNLVGITAESLCKYWNLEICHKISMKCKYVFIDLVEEYPGILINSCSLLPVLTKFNTALEL